MDDIKRLMNKIDETMQNFPLPRRVKITLNKVKKDIEDNNQDISLVITSAVYKLDEVVDDINIPMHSKTVIWDIISDLEALKK